MASLEEKVQRLLDIQEIRDLKTQYAMYCDDQYNPDGIASLFGRGDPARRSLPMTPEDLLEANILIYLQGLGCAPKDPT